MTRRSDHTRHLGLALGFKALVSALVLLVGFRALSDDDYARIVIAQRFAVAPSFDPSGTSWLPFPFWLNGSAMLLFGRAPWVARGVALTSGLFAVALCFAAARRLGYSTRSALLGATLSGVVPYAAWLGVATVPELLTAALIVFGASTAGRDVSLKVRILGGGALCLAALSRYEAWPVVLCFAGFALWDARRDAGAAAAGAVACSGPATWLVHGSLNHDSPFFFIKRVADYHRAVGAGGQSWFSGLLEKPVAFFRCEPELSATLTILLIATWRTPSRGHLGSSKRFIACLAALLAFVVVADMRGAAATHHEERVLLALWLGAALLIGHLALALPTGLVQAKRRALAGIVLAAAAVSGFWLRPWFARRDAFIDRSAHMALGNQAARTAPDARVLIDTPDFGFYAVIAGHGDPRLAHPLDDRDPRRPRQADPFADASALRAKLRSEDARLLIASGDAHRARGREIGFELARAGELSLFALQPPQ